MSDRYQQFLAMFGAPPAPAYDPNPTMGDAQQLVTQNPPSPSPQLLAAMMAAASSPQMSPAPPAAPPQQHENPLMNALLGRAMMGAPPAPFGSSPAENFSPPSTMSAPSPMFPSAPYFGGTDRGRPMPTASPDQALGRLGQDIALSGDSPMNGAIGESIKGSLQSSAATVWDNTPDAVKPAIKYAVTKLGEAANWQSQNIGHPATGWLLYQLSKADPKTLIAIAGGLNPSPFLAPVAAGLIALAQDEGTKRNIVQTYESAGGDWQSGGTKVWQDVVAHYGSGLPWYLRIPYFLLVETFSDPVTFETAALGGIESSLGGLAARGATESLVAGTEQTLGTKAAGLGAKAAEGLLKANELTIDLPFTVAGKVATKFRAGRNPFAYLAELSTGTKKEDIANLAPELAAAADVVPPNPGPSPSRLHGGGPLGLGPPPSPKVQEGPAGTTIGQFFSPPPSPSGLHVRPLPSPDNPAGGMPPYDVYGSERAPWAQEPTPAAPTPAEPVTPPKPSDRVRTSGRFTYYGPGGDVRLVETGSGWKVHERDAKGRWEDRGTFPTRDDGESAAKTIVDGPTRPAPASPQPTATSKAAASPPPPGESPDAGGPPPPAYEQTVHGRTTPVTEWSITPNPAARGPKDLLPPDQWQRILDSTITTSNGPRVFRDWAVNEYEPRVRAQSKGGLEKADQAITDAVYRYQVREAAKAEGIELPPFPPSAYSDIDRMAITRIINDPNWESRASKADRKHLYGRNVLSDNPNDTREYRRRQDLIRAHAMTHGADVSDGVYLPKNVKSRAGKSGEVLVGWASGADALDRALPNVHVDVSPVPDRVDFGPSATGTRVADAVNNGAIDENIGRALMEEVDLSPRTIKSLGKQRRVHAKEIASQPPDGSPPGMIYQKPKSETLPTMSIPDKMTVIDLYREIKTVYGDSEQIRDAFAEALQRSRLGDEKVDFNQSAWAKFDRGWMNAANTAKETMQFNLPYGFSKILQDIVGNVASLLTTGNYRALANVADTDLMRGVAEALSKLTHDEQASILRSLEAAGSMADTGLSIPRRLLPGVTRSDTPSSGDMSIVRNIMRRTGGRGHGVANVIAAPAQFKPWRDIRHGQDLHVRFSLFFDKFDRELVDATKRFQTRLRLTAKKQGVDASLWQDAIVKSAQERAAAEGRVWKNGFNPQDVLDATGSTDLSRAWRAELTNARNAADKEVARVFFTYRNTNADEALRRVTFFHYWMSRASILHARSVLSNPILMASVYRMWKGLEHDARQNGYPPSLVGWFKFMGDTSQGWYGAVNPLAIISSLSIFQEIGGNDDRPFWQKIVYLNPYIQGALDAAGMYKQIPDFTGTRAIGRLVRDNVNYLKAKGWIGGDISYEGLIGRATRRGMEIVNEFAHKHLGAPLVAEYSNPANTQIDQLENSVDQIAIGKYGPRTSPDGTMLWSADQQNHVDDAKNDVVIGKQGNDLADEAYDRWTTARWTGDLASLVAPNQVRYGPADRDKALNKEYRAAEKAGTTPSPEAVAAHDRRVDDVMSPEARSLDRQAERYAALGTDRQQTLNRVYLDIAYNGIPIDWVIVVNNRVIDGGEIAHMAQDERLALADEWLADNDGTDELADLRDKQGAFKADPANSDYASWQDWKNKRRDFAGGPEAYRDALISASEGYRRYIDQLAPATKANPKDFEDASFSQRAFLAFRGDKATIYDRTPPKAGVGQLIVGLSGSGGGKSKSSKASPLAALKSDLSDYNTKMQSYDVAVMREHGSVTGRQLPFDQMPEYMQKYISGRLEMRGITKPSRSKLVSAYLLWRDSMLQQDPNVDIRPEAYIAWLQAYEQSMAA